MNFVALNSSPRRHLRAVLDVLRRHQFFLERNKCSFGEPTMSYLKHAISTAGVAMDDKVQAVMGSSTPSTTRALRGFLGLAGYYRKFIKAYDTITAPLTTLLKKDDFVWSPATQTAFDALKTALTIAPILQLLNFSVRFIVECVASGMGLGAVLHQGSSVIAFFSRPFTARHHSLAAYKRELIGLVQAVRHWPPYLWGHLFLVRTDHYSLKFFLDQRLATIPQHHWVRKLLGFDFSAEYRPGRLNTVADALSRRNADIAASYAISVPHFDLFDAIHSAAASDPALTALRDQIS